MAQMVKNPPAMQETWVRSLGQEDPLEKGMATHSSILVWRISWTEEPVGSQSVGSQTVGQDWTTNTFTFPVRCKYLCTCVWHVCDLLTSLGSIRLCLLEAGRCSDVQNKRRVSPRGPKWCVGDDWQNYSLQSEIPASLRETLTQELNLSNLPAGKPLREKKKENSPVIFFIFNASFCLFLKCLLYSLRTNKHVLFVIANEINSPVKEKALRCLVKTKANYML